MSRTDDCIDAIVLAGGRISGEYASTAKTTVKALVPFDGAPVIERVLRALRDTAAVERVCVVGPAEVRHASSLTDLWTKEEASALANLRTGIESLGSTTRRVLVTASDLPFITAKAVEALIANTPLTADMSLPVITEADYMKAFPASKNQFVPLASGGVTIGSQIIVEARVVTSNLALLQRIFNKRKSQPALAMTLGPAFMFKLLTKKLTIADIQARLSKVTGCRCSAITPASPKLAFDIDTLEDYRDAKARFEFLKREADRRQGVSAHIENTRQPPGKRP